MPADKQLFRPGVLQRVIPDLDSANHDRCVFCYYVLVDRDVIEPNWYCDKHNRDQVSKSYSCGFFERDPNWPTKNSEASSNRR